MSQNLKDPVDPGHANKNSMSEGSGPSNEPNLGQSSGSLFVTAQSSKQNYQKPSVEQETGESSTSKGKGPSNAPKFEQSLGTPLGTGQSNYQKASEESGDYYTTEQKQADRKAGCTEEQISAIENVLKCDLKEWYDILGVSGTCSTEEAHQAYKEKSLAVHPDKNPSKEATKAFQMVSDAATALKAGDDYRGEDAMDWSKDTRKKPSQQRPKATPFQKEIYDQATPYMLALFQDPSLGEPTKELEKLNSLIKQQNEKDGKKEVDNYQGIIDYHTHIAMAKLALECQRLINTPTTNDSERDKQGLAKEKIAQIGPNLDKINIEKDYPRSWNIEEVDTLQGQDPPPQPRGLDTTREGYPILGARQYGKGGYRFLVVNGKNQEDDNPIEYRSSAELGYDIADAYLAGKEKEDWDITKANVSRAKDGKNYRKILGIASNPIKTAKIAIDSNGAISLKPRYPESHMLTSFEKPDGEKYVHILSRTKLGIVIGGGAADQEIANFYNVRPKLTAPWATGPLAVTSGKTRAISQVPSPETNLAALPVMTPAMNIASQPNRTPAINSIPLPNTTLASPLATNEQLLLKNEVEGLKAQMNSMLSLLQTLSMNMPARPVAMA